MRWAKKIQPDFFELLKNEVVTYGDNVPDYSHQRQADAVKSRIRTRKANFVAKGPGRVSAQWPGLRTLWTQPAWDREFPPRPDAPFPPQDPKWRPMHNLPPRRPQGPAETSGAPATS